MRGRMKLGPRNPSQVGGRARERGDAGGVIPSLRSAVDDNGERQCRFGLYLCLERAIAVDAGRVVMFLCVSCGKALRKAEFDNRRKWFDNRIVCESRHIWTLVRLLYSTFLGMFEERFERGLSSHSQVAGN